MEVIRKNPLLLVRMKGRLGLIHGKELIANIRGRRLAKIQLVNINLEKVSFINSSGFGKLIELKKLLAEKGIRLSLSNSNGYLTEMFNITELRDAFEVFETEKEARASMRR